MRPHPALLREPRLTPGWLAAAAAAALALYGSALVAWCGPVDRPGLRTSHGRATPTSGGLAILAGACAGLWVWGAMAGPTLDAPKAWRDAVIVLSAAAALALLGALDDLLDLPAAPKLVLMSAAAVAAIGALWSPWLLLQIAGQPLSVARALPVLVLGSAWLLLVVNAVNFMDGANGLAAGCVAIASFALALATHAIFPVAGACALALAAANMAFLIPNLAGRVFQGDAGALFSAFAFGGLVLLTLGAGGLGFGPLALLPLLTDVLLTLARRARRGVPLMQAHREHLYQRWLQATGKSHLALAWRMWALTAACCALALATEGAGLLVQGGALAAAAATLSAAWLRLSRRLDMRLAGARPGLDAV